MSAIGRIQREPRSIIEPARTVPPVAVRTLEEQDRILFSLTNDNWLSMVGIDPGTGFGAGDDFGPTHSYDVELRLCRNDANYLFGLSSALATKKLADRGARADGKLVIAQSAVELTKLYFAVELRPESESYARFGGSVGLRNPSHALPGLAMWCQQALHDALPRAPVFENVPGGAMQPFLELEGAARLRDDSNTLRIRGEVGATLNTIGAGSRVFGLVEAELPLAGPLHLRASQLAQILAGQRFSFLSTAGLFLEFPSWVIGAEAKFPLGAVDDKLMKFGDRDPLIEVRVELGLGSLVAPLRRELETPAPALDAPRASLSLARAPKRTKSFLEAAADILPRIFTVETSATAATNGFARADLKLGVDLGRFRDQLMPYLSQRDHNALEFAADLIAANGWDLAGTIGSIIAEKMGKDISGSGYYRMREDIRRNGFFGIHMEGFEWKDGNFGSTVNTLHGMPYSILGSAYMRMRGYDPLTSLLTGMTANLLIHETLFERYEQPKSLYDMLLMNTLGAIAGALPNCGMEAQLSLFTKQPTASFYYQDGDRRYSIAFEQQRDFFDEGVPIEQRPVLPWHIELGGLVNAAPGLDVGLRLRLTTSEHEPANALRAIDGLGIGASIRYAIP